MPTQQSNGRLRPRWELRRMVLGALLAVFFNAWASAAVMAVAFSDATSFRDKVTAGLLAPPTLKQEYDRTAYIVEHRQEIEAAIEYFNRDLPSQAQLDTDLQRSRETLEQVGTVDEKFAELRDPDFLDFRKNWYDLKAAWEAIPSDDSLRQVIDVVEPAVWHARSLVPTYYGGLFRLSNNFSKAERASTLAAMAALFVVLWLVGQTVGFWVRRGRPGFIARGSQALGARVFPHWYADNVDYALGKPLSAHARRRVHRELLNDPEAALDPSDFEALEAYFARRTGQR